MKGNPPLLLLSKLAAGGLSAGVVLVWWPVFPHSDGAGSWVLRGIIWTCLFELLVLALSPMEKMLLSTRPAQRVKQQMPDEHSMGRRSALILAGLVLLVCGGLVWNGPASPDRAHAKPQQVQVVKPVKIIKQTVVVEKPVPQKVEVKVPGKTIIKRQTIIRTVHDKTSTPSKTPTPTPSKPSQPSVPPTKTPEKTPAGSGGTKLQSAQG